jgi:hypothetical protein
MSYEPITKEEFEKRLFNWSLGRRPNKSRMVTRLTRKIRENTKALARSIVDGVNMKTIEHMRDEAEDEVLRDEFISRFVKDSVVTNQDTIYISNA